MPSQELEETRRIPTAAPPHLGVVPPELRSEALEHRMAAVERFVENLRRGDPVYADWHEIGTAGEPAFENSWVNFGAAEESAAYRRDGLGLVHIKGLVKSGTVGAVPVFTLPVGFLPAGDIHFATISNDAIGKLQIFNSGEVRANVGSNVWFSLNCRFYADHAENLLFQ